VLWEFNRFLPEKPCQTGIFTKRLLLMLIDVGRLATMRHPTAGAIRCSKGAVRRLVSIHALASAARAASF
jgi:hypothetical protein